MALYFAPFVLFSRYWSNIVPVCAQYRSNMRIVDKKWSNRRPVVLIHRPNMRIVVKKWSNHFLPRRHWRKAAPSPLAKGDSDR